MIEKPASEDWDDYYDILPVYYPHRYGYAFTTRREIAALNAAIPAGGMVLEVGSASGVSVSLLAEEKPNARFFSVDTFVPPRNVGDIDSTVCPDGDHFDRILNWYKNRQPNQILWMGDVRRLQQITTRKFDLIFVDAGHMYDEVYPDLLLSATMLQEGGVMVAHDYRDPNWKQVEEAVDRFCNELNFIVFKTVGSLAFMQRGGR